MAREHDPKKSKQGILSLDSWKDLGNGEILLIFGKGYSRTKAQLRIRDADPIYQAFLVDRAVVILFENAERPNLQAYDIKNGKLLWKSKSPEQSKHPGYAELDLLEGELCLWDLDSQMYKISNIERGTIDRVPS
jgi:hypothetical protein